MYVQNRVVGLVIGRSYQMVNALQKESGCKIDVKSSLDRSPNTEREIMLTGTRDQINKARMAINRVISVNLIFF